MDNQSTPRATAPYLEHYVGRNVTVVGKVVQLRGEEAVIDADGSISARLNRVCPVPSPQRHLSEDQIVPCMRRRGHRRPEPVPAVGP